MRASKSQKKKGKLQIKRLHRNKTQSPAELTLRSYEDRQSWISRRSKK